MAPHPPPISRPSSSIVATRSALRTTRSATSDPHPRDRLDLDLDLPRRIEQRLDHEGGVRRSRVGEQLAVHRADLVEILRVHEEDARAYDVVEGGACFAQRR